MPWGLWSSPSPSGGNGEKGNSNSSKTDDASKQTSPPPPPTPPQPSTKPPPSTTSSPSRILSSVTSSLTSAASSFLARFRESHPISWNESLNATDWRHYVEPRNIIPPLLAAGFALGVLQFWRSYLRRFPGAAHIAPGFFRRRSLLGRVTSVGDGDGFHLFHTPGGRLAGWGWLRRVPQGRKELKGRTIPIRLAGIDAPEGAHFGRPAQPHADEALAFLQRYLLGRTVRARVYKRDQYERVVATVFVRRPPFYVLRCDVGLEMLRRGLATTYEAKTGVEFGGPVAERRYKAAMAAARAKGRGLWAPERPAGGFFWGGGRGKGTPVESPRMYKERMRMGEKTAAAAAAKGAVGSTGGGGGANGKKGRVP